MQKSYARRLILLAGAIIVLIAAYTGIWFYSSARVEAAAAEVIGNAQSRGIDLDCSNREAWGYPFRIGLICDEVRYDNEAHGFGLTAGELRTAAQIYQPALMLGELAGPALFQFPGVAPIRIDWQTLRSSVRLADPLPERISLEAVEPAGAAGPDPVFSAAKVQAHMRPDNADLDIAATIKSLQLHMLRDEGLPPFDAFLDASLADGTAWFGDPAASLRGRSATVRHAHLDLGDAGKASASGTIAVKADGLAEGELTLQFEQAKSLGLILANIFPESGALIQEMAQNLAFFGDNAEIPVRLEAGRVFVGPFEVGAVPALP